MTVWSSLLAAGGAHVCGAVAASGVGAGDHRHRGRGCGAGRSAVITTLHRDRPDLDAVATALARLHNHGHSPSWRGLYPHARTVALPTYPFEHRSYWLAPTVAADVGAAGLGRAEHPLLGAVTELADQDQIVLTGRLSTATQGWLAGHMVGNSVVFPATGFIDVVLRAGEMAGCPVIDELVLHTPLVLVEHPPTDVQIAVHPAEDGGRRAFTVHARTGGEHDPGGLDVARQRRVRRRAAPGVGVFADAGYAETIDQDSFYGELAEQGLRYGGPFRSVRGIGRHPTVPTWSMPRWHCPLTPTSPATASTPRCWTPRCIRWPRRFRHRVGG